ncbi:MAG TPA: YiiD C-terminal domain-containing protein [Fulvivirga sp.]|nr:YiiD C-terminal domain-containing protein [Fulvivirga sp.]
MISQRMKMKLINWWPPMLGTGISLRYIDEKLLKFVVKLKLTWYNRNLVGIHYGGSLYSMCDPWYMFILMANLGKGYVVMDKSANIRYLLPGRGTLKCIFELTEERIQEIKTELDTIGKKDYTFLCEIKNAEGEVVTEVDKIVYVRKKDFDWEKFNK